MKDFVDLKGASGASYRFRRLPEGQAHLRIAGNYAMLKRRAGGFTVVHVGVTDDLSQARAMCPTGTGATHLFTRLNVSRTAREAEHADLVAQYGEASGEAGEGG